MHFLNSSPKQTLMKSNKFLLGGIVGGVAYFLLGWLVWGMLLMNFMKEHSKMDSGAFRDEKDMIWWAMIVGNLALGFLLSYILSKSNAASAGSGAAGGFVFGLLVSIAVNTMLYAQIDLWDTTAMLVDIVAMTVVSTIVGAIIGWLNGMGSKSAG
jgi:hypothetical protein